MSVKWQKFEENCFSYLVKTYGKTAKFIREGESNSTVPDIRVVSSVGEFYVEVKSEKAQSGQFVLLPDDKIKKFVFSPKNKTQENEMTNIIITHMNSDYESFKNADTSGKDIEIHESVFAKWITDYYNSKNVKYFITHNQNYIILPTDAFQEYFSISAKYRIKKSGSANPAKKNHSKIKEIISSKYNIENKYIVSEDKKIFIDGYQELEDEQFEYDGYHYLLNLRNNDRLEVRKLSNTHNMNVVFSIFLKQEQDLADLRKFEKDIL